MILQALHDPDSSHAGFEADATADLALIALSFLIWSADSVPAFARLFTSSMFALCSRKRLLF